MALFITKRLLMALATVLVVAVLAFLLVHAMPGSPGAVSLGAGASREAIDEVNGRLGWNDPLLSQFFRWLGDAVQGNLGTSLIDGRSVSADLGNRLPVTASLAAGATVLSAILGIGLGVSAAVRGGLVDRIVGGICGLAVALPAFWIGIIFVYLFAVQSSVFPATGYVPFEVSPQDWGMSLALPVITLAVGGAAFIARQTRASMLEALQQEHIRTLRATATPTWKSSTSTPCATPASPSWPASRCSSSACSAAPSSRSSSSPCPAWARPSRPPSAPTTLPPSRAWWSSPPSWWWP